MIKLVLFAFIGLLKPFEHHAGHWLDGEGVFWNTFAAPPKLKIIGLPFAENISVCTPQLDHDRSLELLDGGKMLFCQFYNYFELR